MELLQKIRTLRCSATAGIDLTGSKTKSPIYDRIEQQKVLTKIDETLDPMYSLFWRLSVATGWRTSDVLELEYSNVNFDTGMASIVVNKQTKSAEARAFNKVLANCKQQLKKQASLSNDQHRYMIVDMCEIKEIQSLMTEGEVCQLEAELLAAVSSAPVKRDTKKLPRKVLELIQEHKERNHFDNFVFSRHLSSSNRTKNIEGHISRQGVWKGLKSVFNWFSKEVNAALKLSAYSSRKTFAYRLYKGVNGNESNIAEVMQAFGHSSIQMTISYLGLASKADEIQAQMVEV